MADERAVGDWIGGRFEVFEVHGGGMGVVYAALDHAPGASAGLVGLKTLRPALLGDRARRTRFLTEARLWAGIEPHANVVRAMAVEMVDGAPHLVMEWVGGGDLRGWIGTPRLTVARALRFGVEFCLGMEHALRGGVGCHRDVKPANLLVAADGTLKIADFGLARLRDDFLALSLDGPGAPIPLEEPARPSQIVWTDPRDRGPGESVPEAGPGSLDGPATMETSDDLPAEVAGTETLDWVSRGLGEAAPEGFRQTVTGSVMGTVAYMAPEQFADARAVDVRADIYAFGVVLYEMLAGRRPFEGRTPREFRRAHEAYDPRPLAPILERRDRRLRRHAGAIEEVVLRCLVKNPAHRYATMAALRKDLLALLRAIGARLV
jgi:serine/threonine protein kinase